MKTFKFFATIIMSLATSVALAAGVSSSVYNSSETMNRATVEIAQVVDMRHVQIQNNQQNMVGQYGLPVLGGVMGAALGQLVGSTPATQTLATVLMTAAGGYAGQAINQISSKQDGIEFVLKGSDGKYFAITQPADVGVSSITIGDQVRLIQDGVTRIVKLGSGV